MKHNKIHLITTGGTIDSYYDTERCTAVPHQHSVLQEFLSAHAGVAQDRIESTALCMKDSRDITDSDIEEVSLAIMRSHLHAHIVTHGTFTMFDSARLLEKLLPENHQQVVVFTGSMIPLQGFTPNDAGFNLGSAMVAAQCLEPGVYIAFNGQIYKPDAMQNLH